LSKVRHDSNRFIFVWESNGYFCMQNNSRATQGLVREGTKRLKTEAEMSSPVLKSFDFFFTDVWITIQNDKYWIRVVPFHLSTQGHLAFIL
jgi:hypothetical protein